MAEVSSLDFMASPEGASAYIHLSINGEIRVFSHISIERNIMMPLMRGLCPGFQYFLGDGASRHPWDNYEIKVERGTRKGDRGNLGKKLIVSSINTQIQALICQFGSLSSPVLQVDTQFLPFFR